MAGKYVMLEAEQEFSFEADKWEYGHVEQDDGGGRIWAPNFQSHLLFTTIRKKTCFFKRCDGGGSHDMPARQ
jgi:hypothetical protein